MGSPILSFAISFSARAESELLLVKLLGFAELDTSVVVVPLGLLKLVAPSVPCFELFNRSPFEKGHVRAHLVKLLQRDDRLGEVWSWGLQGLEPIRELRKGPGQGLILIEAFIDSRLNQLGENLLLISRRQSAGNMRRR